MRYVKINKDDDEVSLPGHTAWVPATPGRPTWAEGDTGLEFRGWYSAGNVTLSHAASDDDPRCVRVLCLEAKYACERAFEAAKNPRQKEMALSLLWSVERVDELAESMIAM